MDCSFLRFTLNDFDKAMRSENQAISSNNYTGMVQMLPNETFFQITNLESDIAFAGNIRVELINCNQEVIKIITELFFYNEFTDIKGIRQLAFEFGNIGIDYFGMPLFLKVSHTVSEKVWYSNAFFISAYKKELTTGFAYKNENYFNGISYDKAPYFQTVRLACFENDVDVKKEVKDYTQLSGNQVSLRNISTFITQYKMEVCDKFTFNRMSTMFDHDIIYLDNYRVSNKPGIKKGVRKGQSNFFAVDFELNKTEEFRPSQYQLFHPFSLISKIPTGSYTLAKVPNTIKGMFNRVFTLGSGTLKVYNSENVLIATYTEKDISVGVDYFQINSTRYITANGGYYIMISEGLFTSVHGEAFRINDNTTWPFIVKNGDYSSADYRAADYFEN